MEEKQKEPDMCYGMQKTFLLQLYHQHGIQIYDSISMLYQTTKLARDANSLRLKASRFS